VLSSSRLGDKQSDNEGSPLYQSEMTTKILNRKEKNHPECRPEEKESEETEETEAAGAAGELATMQSLKDLTNKWMWSTCTALGATVRHASGLEDTNQTRPPWSSRGTCRPELWTNTSSNGSPDIPKIDPSPLVWTSVTQTSAGRINNVI